VLMNKVKIIFLIFIFFLSCDKLETKYSCATYSCVENDAGLFHSIDECEQNCLKPNQTGTRVTVFLYENCPIAQYMCGPLRNTYRYFCDTLNEPIIFRAFSPNAFSTEESLANFIEKYDIPFNVELDYDYINETPGNYTQYYQPTVTPEVFIEFNGEVVYKGMIDNSYQSLGDWTPPTENYLADVLQLITNNQTVYYSETEAIGCFINY